MHQILNFILFCSSTLHVLDGLSVHHQESKIVHTASGICQIGSVAACWRERDRTVLASPNLFPLASSQQNLYSLRLLMIDGKTVRKM